jgi:hypothetical protein
VEAVADGRNRETGNPERKGKKSSENTQKTIDEIKLKI